MPVNRFTPARSPRLAVRLALLTATLLDPVAQASNAPPPPAGVRAFETIAEHRSEPLRGVLWYPIEEGSATPVAFASNAVWQGVQAVRDAEPLPASVSGPLPLVVLSHGLGGNHRSVAWLASALVARGAAVVAIDHPGSSTFDFDPVRSLEHGRRAQDLSSVLDSVLERAPAGLSIDATRLFAAGFSYGGWTVLSLAGLRGDLDGYREHCVELAEASSHCADIARWGVDLGVLDPTEWNADYRDERIAAVAALDPGLIWGLDERAGVDVDVPVLLITLGDPVTRLPATDVEASGLLERLRDADRMTIAPAGHFSGLGLCTERGPAILAEDEDDPVCDDTPGEDRSVTHARVVDAIAAHLGLR